MLCLVFVYFRGVLQADAFASCNPLYEDGRIVEASFWSMHAQRCATSTRASTSCPAPWRTRHRRASTRSPTSKPRSAASDPTKECGFGRRRHLEAGRRVRGKPPSNRNERLLRCKAAGRGRTDYTCNGSSAHGRAGGERPLGFGVVAVFDTPRRNDRSLRSPIFATGRRTPAAWVTGHSL